MNKSLIQESFDKLKRYCEEENFKGWDPYDGLNSQIFNAIPFLNKSRLIRLLWIQFFKRSPFNFRNFFLIKKDYNPKGLGLFLLGYCNLYRIEPKTEYLDKIKFLAEKVISLQTKGYSGACWGYNFPWQAKAFYQPRYFPTVVATSFISCALLDAFEITGEQKYYDIAVSSADFVLKDLNRTYNGNGDFCFSYSPSDKTQVFNASLLASRLLARIFYYTKEKHLIVEAEKSVAYCINHQGADGSWSYGLADFQKWIDNFHTGYNLQCLYDYAQYSGDLSFIQQTQKGLKYYLETFFTEKGETKYYNNKLFPIDIHNPAQIIATLKAANKFSENIDLINKVLDVAISEMQDKQGYFYYQKKKNAFSKIPYIRWAQAWMFYALSEYLFQIKNQNTK